MKPRSYFNEQCFLVCFLNTFFKVKFVNVWYFFSYERYKIKKIGKVSYTWRVGMFANRSEISFNYSHLVSWNNGQRWKKGAMIKMKISEN